MKEEWKAIPGYEGFYEASTLGRIRSIGRVITLGRHDSGLTRKYNGRVRSESRHSRGYKTVRLNKKGARDVFYVHRLIAVTFLANPNSYKDVNHVNAVKDDNRVCNLEWCSRSQNMKHFHSLKGATQS